MFRKFFYASLIALSSLSISAGELVTKDHTKQYETQYSTSEHYFKIEVINGITFLCEYEEDGTLVNITELSE